MRVSTALLWLLAASVAAAAPPTVTVPETVKGDVSAFVVVKAEVKDGKGVKFVSLDPGLNVFPGGLLVDPAVTVVTSAKAGKYRLLCYSGNADGPSEPAYTVVVIGEPVKPEPPLPPGPNPDPDTPPDQPADPPAAGKLYFVLVREPNVPVTPAVRSSIVLPAWKELNAAGHRMKAIPLDKLAPEYAAKVTKTPSLVVVRVDGATSTYLKTVDVPTTDDAVRALLK